MSFFAIVFFGVAFTTFVFSFLLLFKIMIKNLRIVIVTALKPFFMNCR